MAERGEGRRGEQGGILKEVVRGCRRRAGNEEGFKVELGERAVGEDHDGAAGGDELPSGGDEEAVEGEAVGVGSSDGVLEVGDESLAVAVEAGKDFGFCGQGEDGNFVWSDGPEPAVLRAEPVEEQGCAGFAGDEAGVSGSRAWSGGDAERLRQGAGAALVGELESLQGVTLGDEQVDGVVVETGGVGDEGESGFLALELGASLLKGGEGVAIGELGGLEIALTLLEAAECVAGVEAGGGGVVGFGLDGLEERLSLLVLMAGGGEHALGETDVGTEAVAGSEFEAGDLSEVLFGVGEVAGVERDLGEVFEGVVDVFAAVDLGGESVGPEVSFRGAGHVAGVAVDVAGGGDPLELGVDVAELGGIALGFAILLESAFAVSEFVEGPT